MTASPASKRPAHRERVLTWAGDDVRLGHYVASKEVARVDIGNGRWFPWARVDAWVSVPDKPTLEEP
jgi:hypothetical protein